MSVLISVPAGKCHRRSADSKWVDPQPGKGLIEMKFEDDLMHLWWRNKSTNNIEDELIVFPGEAVFERVTQDKSGRTHILKFSSSDQSYFFWFQRPDKITDLRACVDLNQFLQDPTYRAGTAPLPKVIREVPPHVSTSSSRGPPGEDRSWPPTPNAPRITPGEPLPSRMNLPETPADANADDSVAAMARIIAQFTQTGGLGAGASAGAEDPARLTDVLSSANITALVKSDPTIGSRLKPLLPARLNLPDQPSEKDLIAVLTAPQMTDAVASLENALRSGGLPGGMMRDLGLPEDAGQSVRAFLDALKGLKKGGAEEDRMETDE